MNQHPFLLLLLILTGPGTASADAPAQLATELQSAASAFYRLDFTKTVRISQELAHMGPQLGAPGGPTVEGALGLLDDSTRNQEMFRLREDHGADLVSLALDINSGLPSGIANLPILDCNGAEVL